MSLHNSRVRRTVTRRVATVSMTGVAIITVLGLTACAGLSPESVSAWKTELDHRGFTNISDVINDNGAGNNTHLWVNAGGCRGTAVINNENSGFSVVFADSAGEPVEFIAPANATVVTQSEALAFCAELPTPDVESTETE